MATPVPETINFPLMEESVLNYWSEIDAFRECSKQSKSRPLYSFYDGPPFATGLPHYGHILAGTIKDVVTRYAYQNGHRVERRFGWDCHGLPVEFEIDKKFGFQGPEDIEKYGVANYNRECRKIVMQYSGEWEHVVQRIGRWIDFKNDYKTMYPWFMESVWWVFSELWNKGLVFRGVKVMPFSTACNTPLSNFESGQNYKEVVDPAIVVMFPLKYQVNTYLLAWTTTPWTLPSNLALCVNPGLMYVKLEEELTGKFYILMESRTSEWFSKQGDGTYIRNGARYVARGKFVGKKIAGQTYIPLFPYFSTLSKAFIVLCDCYVTEESGTGIVHQAPYFGEDDYRVCLSNGVITNDQDPICPIDASGKFTEPVADFFGQYVKDADKNIIQYLKNKSLIFSVGTIHHNYPFCWRSDTPLIYRAVPSWFIRVQHMSDSLLKANGSTHWVPEFVKEKRFGNWLREARDWAVSRNRFWGTPIPLWVSEDWEEIVCISSIRELEELTSTKVTDLHRESIDRLTIPSKRNGVPPLKRISEVFDCWFESGSMPYAQLHYPFENKDEFDKKFPADFIAEGIDQTRGWFYTLLVISTALFNKAPFKNLIVNGLVLAADGQKMSKSKQNYPDPLAVINKYGADALRLYLINSPVVRADKLKFREEGVRDILKEVFLPWYNAYRFLIQNVIKLQKESDIALRFSDDEFIPTNLMDKWILSFTQSLNVFVRKEMEAYRLYTVVPRLVGFIDNLTNWYVKMNRRRLKGETGVEDCCTALSTLGCVLCSMVRLMAPHTPFLTEQIYKNLKLLTNRREESIHFVQMPSPRTELIDPRIEHAISKMQTVIDLGRVIRDRKNVPLKFPLREIIIILDSEEAIQEVKLLEVYIKEELNVKKVVMSCDKNTFGVSFRAEPDHKTLGPKLKDQFKPITTQIKNLSNELIETFKREGKIEICGVTLVEGDLRIMLTFSGEAAQEMSTRYEPNVQDDVLVLLDFTPDASMLAEGTAREMVNRIQKLRKKAKLVPTDEIQVYCTVYPDSSPLATIASDFSSFIKESLKAEFILRQPDKTLNVIITSSEQLKSVSKDTELRLAIVSLRKRSSPKQLPCCRFINFSLSGGVSSSKNSQQYSILLENPVRYNQLTLTQLKLQAQSLYDLLDHDVELRTPDSLLLTETMLHSYCGDVIVTLKGAAPEICNNRTSNGINVKFVNVSVGQIRGTILVENPVGVKLVSNIEEARHRAHNMVTAVCGQPLDQKDILIEEMM